jgi:hypothetical protein
MQKNCMSRGSDLASNARMHVCAEVLHHSLEIRKHRNGVIIAVVFPRKTPIDSDVARRHWLRITGSPALISCAGAGE